MFSTCGADGRACSRAAQGYRFGLSELARPQGSLGPRARLGVVAGAAPTRAAVNSERAGWLSFCFGFVGVGIVGAGTTA